MKGALVGEAAASPQEVINGGAGVKLTTTEDVLLEVLAHLTGTGSARASRWHLAIQTGRSQNAISRAVKGLETKGLLTIKQGSLTKGANLYKLTKQGVLEGQRMSPFWMAEWAPLPDAFRVRDFTNPGTLWQRVPKGEAMTLGQVWERMPTAGKPSVREWLQRLEDLPVPFVVSGADPDRMGWKSYTFQDVDADGQVVNLAHLSERLKRWSPVTMREREDRHDYEMTHLRARIGVATYVDLAPFIEANTTRTEFGCMIGPEEWRDSGGYIQVPGVKAPGIRGHRIMYWAIVGPIPAGHELHHWYCNTPSCVNPRHLAPVTPEDHREHGKSWAPLRGEGMPVTFTYTDPEGDGDPVETHDFDLSLFGL